MGTAALAPVLTQPGSLPSAHGGEAPLCGLLVLFAAVLAIRMWEDYSSP